MSVDSAFVALPKYSTLAGAATFSTLPMDTSSFGGTQFQVFRGPIRTKTPTPTPKFTLYFEESLDTYTWVAGPSAPGAFEVADGDVKFFSYSFRLRWFRLRIVLAGDEPIVTCWAEGLLRGGGGGLWLNPSGRVAGEIIGSGRSSKVATLEEWLRWQRLPDQQRSMTPEPPFRKN